MIRAETPSQLEIDPPATTDRQVLREPRPDGRLAALARAWIEHDDTFWASVKVDDLARSDDSDVTWSVILDLVQEATTDHQLWLIGAGPLEDFLGRHGKAWIERVEERTAADPKFAYALARCLLGTLADEVSVRVQRASERGSRDTFFTA